jgi:hypothetical protein
MAAALHPVEYSIGSCQGAERMHKTVLPDLDVRSRACKVSFDVSNAHIEFERGAAADAIRQLVPELLPWVRTSFTVATTHLRVSSDGACGTISSANGTSQTGNV